MPDHRVALVTVACIAVLTGGCTGCTDREQATAGAPDGSVSAPEPFFGLVEPEPPASRAIGQDDAANRYPSTVSLLGEAPGERPRYRECSGVLVASNLVLTAAHCLCSPSHGETIRFDGSECAETAEVSTYDFEPRKDGHREGTVTYPSGNVIIHPKFLIVIDTQGAIVTSRADLAIIRLKHPVRHIRPVRLAAEDARAGEVLSVVGYIYFEAFDGYDGRRRFSREKVQTPADGERVLFGSMDLASYKGDTGGPCLRETERGPELVGISQRGLGLAPAFTSIAPYREWLEEQIRLANESP